MSNGSTAMPFWVHAITYIFIIETAARVSALIRTFGHAHTEIWTATEWDRLKELVRTLPGPG